MQETKPLGPLVQLLASDRCTRNSIDAVVRFIRLAGLEQEAARELGHRTDTASRWITAALEESSGTSAESLYAQVLDAKSLEIPDVLLIRARLAVRAGDPVRAAALLKLALRCQPDYSFFLRAEALVNKCRSSFEIRRTAKIALIGSCTTALLKSVIDLLCVRDGIDAAFYEAPFGTYKQEILDRDSSLYRFKPDFVILLLTWRDVQLGTPVDDPDVHVRTTLRELQSLWSILLSAHPCHVLQPTFGMPLTIPNYAVSPSTPTGTTRLLREINRALLECCPNGVTLLDTELMAARYHGRWESPVHWSSAKLYPSPGALPTLSENIVSCIRAALGLSSKLLALDLDNTLWGGIVGEDGLNGIKLGPPSAVGERYQELHGYLKHLKKRGVLLAVVSKNNQEDAAQVFQFHECSILKMDDFVAFESNWQPKTTSLRKIASRLNIGLDSIVFLDDNPSERAAVRSELPEIIVPEVSGEPVDSIAAIERGLYFQTIRITEEDLLRSASYAALAATPPAAADETTLQGYLSSLQMEIQTGPVSKGTCTRVTQLMNKTNQFNLTTRRYREEEVVQRSKSEEHWFRWFRLRDRFADHGLIAVLLAERVSTTEWLVDSWLMSCRVIGRAVEYFMFNTLLQAARAEGVRTIRAQYLPTAKNKPVQPLLPNLGFILNPATELYDLDVDVASYHDCPHLAGSQAPELVHL